MKTQAFLQANSRLLISLLLTAVVITFLVLIGRGQYDPPISYGYNAGETVAFQVASSSGLESVTSVSLTVELSAAMTHDATVDFEVSGGTATGGDFTLADGTLTFSAGDTSETISITIVDNAAEEPDETIVVTLSATAASQNVNLGSPSAHTYTIINDDTTVSFPSSTSSGLESVSPVNLTVNLSSTQYQCKTKRLARRERILVNETVAARPSRIAAIRPPPTRVQVTPSATLFCQLTTSAPCRWYV